MVLRELLLKFMPMSLQLIMIDPLLCPAGFLLPISLPFLLEFFLEIFDPFCSTLTEGSLGITVLLLSPSSRDVGGWLAAGLGAGLDRPVFHNGRCIIWCNGW